MSYNFVLFIILFAFWISLDIEIFSFEVNHGKTKNITSLIKKVWIYTKIEKSSQIIVGITNYDKNRVINQVDVEYSKYNKKTNETNFIPIKLFVANGNSYTCTYEISKDKNNYGVLQIKNLGVGQKINIKVTVLSKATYWFFIVLGIILGLLLIIGLFILCRTFLRCCKKYKK